jgi:hypothetical protein
MALDAYHAILAATVLCYVPHAVRAWAVNSKLPKGYR